MANATAVEVAAAVITDAGEEILLSLHERWGMFSLPMSKLRSGPVGGETPEEAALRAAVEVLGVPVRLAASASGESIGMVEVSGRDLTEKSYLIHLLRVEPHPDFANRVVYRQPHIWVAPYLLSQGEYEPVSPMVPRLVERIQMAFGMPDRVQAVTTIILSRETPDGPRYLLRWSPKWEAWNFPSRRRDPKSENTAADSFETVVRKELGADVIPGLLPIEPEIIIDSVPSGNRAKPWRNVLTRYSHLVGQAVWNPESDPASDEPLRWATPAELASRELRGGSGRISATARELAARLIPAVQQAIQRREEIETHRWIAQVEAERDFFAN